MMFSITWSRHPRAVRRGWPFITLLLAACSQASGTETGNPVLERPPYESPAGFNPDDPTPPGCPPSPIDTWPTKGRNWASAGNALLVGAGYREGLRVIDVSDAQVPVLLTTVPLKGNVLALAASGNDVAIIVQEPPEVPTDEVATEAALELVPRLVHFDLSDPNKPMRVGEVDIDGEYWDLRVQAGVVWLMSAEVAQPNACLLPGQGCGGLDRTAMQVRGYRFADEGFEAIADVSLPLSGRAWAAADGFVTESGVLGDGTHRLSVARIVGDGLELSELDGDTSPLHGSPVGVVGDKLYVFTEDGSSSALEVIDVGSAAAQPLARVTGLPARPQTAIFEAERVIVANPDYTQAGTIVTLLAPSQPEVRLLPSGVAHAMPLPKSEPVNDGPVNEVPPLLGWGDVDGSGALTIGLVVEGEAGSELVREVQTEMPAPSGSLGDTALYQPNTVNTGNAVAFLYHHYEPTQRLSAVGVLDLSTDPIAFSTHETAYASELVMVDGWAHAPGITRLTSVPLDAPEAPSADVTLEFEEAALDLIDALPSGDRTLSLVRTLDGVKVFVTELGPDSQSSKTSVTVARLSVPGEARRLLPAGDLVAVVADGDEQYCGDGANPCEERKIVIVDPRGEPRVVTELPLPNPVHPSLDVTSTQTSSWTAPVRIENGSWVLGLQQSTECVLVAECERLGIEPLSLSEAHFLPSSPVQDCPPEVNPCELPPPPPPPEVYGRRTTLDLYLFDAEAAADSEASLTKVGRSTLELFDSSFAPLRASGNAVLVSRAEVKLRRGESIWTASTRFMLDTFDVQARATTSALTAVNLPGVALGVHTSGLGEGYVVYTAEPPKGKGERATLYRLQVSEGEALVMAKRTLPGRYGDVRLFGEVAQYIEQGADSCTPGAVHAFALDETLSPLGSAPLSGGNWRYHDSDADKLLLWGPNYSGYALLDATESPAQLVEFRSAASTGPIVRLRGGELWSPEPR